MPSFAKYKQCLRGNSFGTELDLLDLAPVDGRTSTVVLDPKKPLLPPQLEDKPTVVFDLDETLVYSRDGPLYVRPHFKRLLAFTCLFFETVVWTAGSQEYAELVCQHIDPDNTIIQHCIYRHDKWYKEEGPLRGQKDLRKLGRDMSKLIIIENNPDSIRGNSNNSILLEDYEGPVESDLSLIAVMEFLSRWLKSDVSIPEYLSISPLVQLRPVDSKDSFDAYHIDTSLIRAPLFEIDLIPRLKWMFSSIVGGYEEEREESTNGDESSTDSDNNKSSRTKNTKQSKTNKRRTKGRKTRLYRRKRVDNLVVKSRVENILGFSLPANVAEILDAAGSLARLCAASLMISSL